MRQYVEFQTTVSEYDDTMSSSGRPLEIFGLLYGYFF